MATKLLSSVHAAAQQDPKVKVANELKDAHERITAGLDEINQTLGGQLLQYTINEFDINKPVVSVVLTDGPIESKGFVHITPTYNSDPANAGTYQVFRSNNGSGGKLSERDEATIDMNTAEGILNNFIAGKLTTDAKAQLAATGEQPVPAPSPLA